MGIVIGGWRVFVDKVLGGCPGYSISGGDVAGKRLGRGGRASRVLRDNLLGLFDRIPLSVLVASMVKDGLSERAQIAMSFSARTYRGSDCGDASFSSQEWSSGGRNLRSGQYFDDYQEIGGRSAAGHGVDFH